MKLPRLAAACLLPLLVFAQAGRAYALRIERISRFSPASGKNYSVEVAAGSALVRFKKGVSTSAASVALASAGFSVLNSFERFNWSVVTLPNGLSVEAGLLLLKSNPVVELAEPNLAYRAKRVPNDIYAVRQYALAKVQAFPAWEYETGFSSRVTVAVLDTGIEGSHPDISAKLVGTSRAFPPGGGAGYDDQPPTAACNHATRVAGIAAAVSDNAIGVAGMSWGAKLISLKVFSGSDCYDSCADKAGYGSCATTDAAMAAAIAEMIGLHNTSDIGKVIINISLGESATCNPVGLLQTAVTNAVSSGLLIFSAAGNAGTGFIDAPANCSGVTAVGATDIDDSLASFSNTDTLMITKGLTAPGVDLYTTSTNGGYSSASGTSFSSPLTAGLAALLWSVDPSTTASHILEIMKNSADDLGSPGPDRDFGWGRINAFKAICEVVSCRASSARNKKAVAYPNPFSPKTQNLVLFKLDQTLSGTGLEVKIYTSEGELVKKLEGLAWDGKNEAGAAVASGVYVFRVKTDKDAAVGKLALIR